MLDGLPIASILDGAGTVACIVLFGFLLATGRICTGRELREKNDRITTLEATVATRDAQIYQLVSTLRPIGHFMGSVHEVAEQVRSSEVERLEDTSDPSGG